MVIAAPPAGTPLHTTLHHRLVVTVAGVPVDALAADTGHDTRRYTGGASITLPLPLPAHLVDAVTGELLSQPVTIQMGHDETGIRPVFVGRIDDTAGEIDERDATITIRCSGGSTVLDWPEPTDLVYAGPIALADIFRSLCARRGVPIFRAESVLAPDGAVVLLGGNPDVNDGNVVIPKRQSPLAWLNRQAGLVGYAVFDAPDGTLVLGRVAGAPPASAVAATYVEGVDPFVMREARTTVGMATDIRVTGASGTDRDGVPFEIRSFAATVPAEPLLDPPGYRTEPIADRDIATQAHADAVRHVAETTLAAPQVTTTWEVVGDPWRAPGEVVAVDFGRLGAAGPRWLTGVRHVCDGDGYTTTLTGETGGGTALPAGEDSDVIDVRIAPIHIGNERVAWYAQPNPQGKTVEITITVPETYTALAISGWAHGCNSQLIGGANEDLTVSKIEVYQNQGQDDPDKPVGTAELPVMSEDYAKRLPYGAGLTHWTWFRMAVPGRLEPGTATIRFVAGENTKVGDTDDYELQQVRLTLTGVGEPVLPTTGGGA